MTAAKRDIFFRGKCKYFKLTGRGDDRYEKWSTILYLDPTSYKQFVDLQKGTDSVEGVLNEVKKDDDGYYVSLGRPWTKVYKGKEQAFTPPLVFDNKGQPWPVEIYIGNGSDVTVKCELYTFKPPFKNKRGSALRLVSARVEDLVPYEPNRDLTDDQKAAAKGLADQKTTQYF